MNAYKLEVLVIDFDHIGEQGVKDAICNARYPNHCISPSVEAIQSADIGVWSDDHPLNNSKTCEAEYRRLFERTTSPVMDAPDTSQDWAKLDGATAFHLIERHAEDWAETGRMMESWLAARMAAAAPHAQEPVDYREIQCTKCGQYGLHLCNDTQAAEPVARMVKYVQQRGRKGTITAYMPYDTELTNVARIIEDVPLYAAQTTRQPQVKPNADCSGDPKSCADNEGYGCACDPMNKAASAKKGGAA